MSYSIQPIVFEHTIPENLFRNIGNLELKSVSERLAAIIDKDLCKNPFFAYLCEGNLGVSRSEMPQVEGGTLSEYLIKKINEGVNVTSQLIPARQLTPVQNEMNKFIFHHFIENVSNQEGDNPCTLPVLVSTNNPDGKIFVIDGTHRSAACAAINGTQVVTAIHENVHTILNQLKNFPGVFRIDLNVL